ncbi:MAG: hypothetical protein HGA51_04765 [Demequinaceae bacterium]|nr:hypothetical protein [Demequinaceae bacterium]
MTADTSLRPYAGDPDPANRHVATSEISAAELFADSQFLGADDNAVTGAISVGTYRPIAQPVASTGRFGASRRIKRLTETREIRVRTTHKRRKFVARGGVLAGFGLAMVVYPIMGNVVEYHSNSAEAVPGVVLGQTPTTGHALLGDGPSLIPTVLDLPAPDEKSQAYTMADTAYIASPLLPNCVLPPTFDGEENGKLAASDLCLLPDGKNYLRADAAQNFAQLNEQFKAHFGRDICLIEGYRSYADQIAIRAKRGYLAASPGTSMHGFGVAFDLCGGDDEGAPLKWLNATAAAYGFVNPDWAKFRKFEPWHWEYLPATDALGFYGNSDAYADGGQAAATPAPAVAAPVVTNPTPAPTPAAVAPVVP